MTSFQKSHQSILDNKPPSSILIKISASADSPRVAVETGQPICARVTISRAIINIRYRAYVMYIHNLAPAFKHILKVRIGRSDGHAHSRRGEVRCVRACAAFGVVCVIGYAAAACFEVVSAAMSYFSFFGWPNGEGRGTRGVHNSNKIISASQSQPKINKTKEQQTSPVGGYLISTDMWFNMNIYSIIYNFKT